MCKCNILQVWKKKETYINNVNAKDNCQFQLCKHVFALKNVHYYVSVCWISKCLNANICKSSDLSLTCILMGLCFICKYLKSPHKLTKLHKFTNYLWRQLLDSHSDHQKPWMLITALIYMSGLGALWVISTLQVKYFGSPGQPKPANYNQHSQMASLSRKYQSSFQWQVSTTKPDASSRRHKQRLENVNTTSLVWCWSSQGLLVRNCAQICSTEHTSGKV